MSAARRIAIDGTEFHALTEDEVISEIMGELRRGRGGTVLTPNVDILRQLHRTDLKKYAESADLVVADGAPVVLASRLLGDPLPERVTGSALIHTLSAAVLAQGGGVMLLGGQQPDVAQRAAERLEDSNPEGTVSHHYPPFGFEESEQHLEVIDSLIRAHEPDVVFVGLGFPKQEELAQALHAEHSSTWFVGCGGSIAMLAGDVPRAPLWVQRMGVEWLYRLYREPVRLFRRYIVHDVPYALSLLTRSGLVGVLRSLANAHLEDKTEVATPERRTAPGPELTGLVSLHDEAVGA